MAVAKTEEEQIAAMKKDPDFKAAYHPLTGNAFTGKNKRVVFDGEVMERFGFPGFYPGFIAAWQGVRYRIIANKAGDISEKEIIVHHLLSGPHMESDYPAVSKKVFAVGKQLRIVAERTPSGDYVCWEQKENVTPLKSK